MSQQAITIGTADGHGGMTPFDAWTVTVANFTDLYSITGIFTGYTTTATAAGTTTLTVSSNRTQSFTGTTTQTVLLPVTSTLVLGREFNIVNNSTGAVTVQSSGANTIQIMEANSTLTVRCILLSGTGTASWSSIYTASNPMTTWGDLVYGGDPGSSGVAPFTRLGAGPSGYFLQSNGSGAALSWAAPGGLSGLTATRIPVATSASTVADFNGLKWDDTGRTLTVGYSSGGNNILFLGTLASGLNMNTSTGELRMAAAATHFPTFYSNNGEAMRIPSATKDLLIGSTTDNARLYVVQGTLTSLWTPVARFTAGTHTGMTASTPFPEFQIDGASQTWGSGTIAIQPKAWIKASTFNGTSGTNTATIAAGLQVDPYIIGSNAAITTNASIYSTGKFAFDQTITTGGTTGNQTINKPAGTVNIAAAGTTVTVTNSLCTTLSSVTAVIRTNDATAYIKNVVPSSGSFVINLGAAATAEISIYFKVEN